MPNETTKAFREMMLSGRINQLMTEAVQEGIAATEAAQKATGWVRPICMLPQHRSSDNWPDDGSEFEIPDYVLKDEPKSKD